MTKHHIHYGKTVIEFDLKFRDRKKLLIQVHPDMRIETVAPLDTTIEDIKAKVEKRARWIMKQQRFFASFLPYTPEREYVSGETHKYLGRQYLLKIRPSTENKVVMENGNLIVYASLSDKPEQVKKMVQQWYQDHAKKWFSEMLEDCFPLFAKEKIAFPTLQIKRMTHRWGSCTPTGKIVLHPDIIQAPVGCIRYVVIHELCHLVIPHHNRAFYDLLERKLPDWQKWKEILDISLK